MLSVYEECKAGKQSKTYADVDILADEDVSKDIQTGLSYSEGINYARDLANTPANIMTPKRLSEEAKELADRYGLECTILNKQDLIDLKAGALLAVNQGSDEDPYMIVVRYQGKGEEDPYTALIGKGLTFDAGGYNLICAAARMCLGR